MTIRKKQAYNIVEPKTEQEWLKIRREMFLTASDNAAARGISKWKTPLELWGEKTGLKQPKDISNSPVVIRGKEREPIIREAFKRKNLGIACDYHPYNIYVSNKEGYGMLGATLDGELEVIGDNDYDLPIGYKGVLEIKTVSATEFNRDIVDGWLNGIVPDYYLAQVYQQLFCYDADFALVVAELDYGEEAEERYITVPPILIESDKELFEIERAVREAASFWNNCVETRTPPATAIEAETAQGTEIVPILADAEVGSFYQNFDIVKKSIIDIVEPYRGIQFTEDQEKEAKELKANLNKMAKEIDAKRIAVKKKYLKPLEYFESKANELKGVIIEVIEPISEQIEEFENNRIYEKEESIEGMIAELVLTELTADMAAFLNSAGGITKDKRWLNKGYKESDIRKDITAQIDSFKASYESIIAFSADDSELRSMMLSEFARTKNLADALKAKERIEASREASRIAEERAKEKAEELKARMRARKEEEEAKQRAKDEQRAVQAPASEPAPEMPKEEPQQEEITFTFKASHSSKAEWKALVEYMREHGFRYERIQ